MNNKNIMTITDSPEGTEAVIAFLREHPNFLVEHPDLLSEITIPHTTGVATSLVERQVSVLREQVRQHKNQLTELINIAKENGQLSERLQILMAKLIGASDLESLLATIKKSLISDFKADKIVIRIMSDHNQVTGQKNLSDIVGKEWPQRSLFEEILNHKNPVCGRLNGEQHKIIFGDELPEYGSSVLVPLFGRTWTGLLAIGSQHPERYTKDMGTDILSQMAGIVTLAIDPYITK